MHRERTFFSLFILCAFLLLDGVEAIRNGDVASPGHFTYTAVLKKMGQYHCSASIIGKNHVVTAARCVYDDVFDPRGRYRTSLLQVIIGTTDYHRQESPIVRVRVDKIYIPAIYKRRMEAIARTGDISVLRLAQSLDFRIDNIGISKLFLPETALNPGESATLTGFGWSTVVSELDRFIKEVIRRGTSDGLLRSARVKVLPLADCQYFNNEYLNSLNHVCARVEQHDPNKPIGACTGDTGGPLVAGGDTLVGILTSYDSMCDETVKPQVYTNVASYIQFISNAVADKDDPGIYSMTI